MEESLCGQLLLASPALMDPNFRRAVVLVGVHSEEGAMGVVLNRPSEVTVSEAVPQLEQTVRELEPVYVGGPVQPSSIVFLAEFLDPTPAGLLVLGRIGFPAPDAGIDELTEATARRRVFAGLRGLGRGPARRRGRPGRLDRAQRRPRRRVHRRARGSVEQRAHAHGRQLRADRPDAAGPERQLANPRPACGCP